MMLFYIFRLIDGMSSCFILEGVEGISSFMVNFAQGIGMWRQQGYRNYKPQHADRLRRGKRAVLHRDFPQRICPSS